MSEQFILTFATTKGTTKQVRVPEPDPGMTAGGVTVAANRMIAGNVFDVKGGDIVALRKAELQKTTRTVII